MVDVEGEMRGMGLGGGVVNNSFDALITVDVRYSVIRKHMSKWLSHIKAREKNRGGL